MSSETNRKNTIWIRLIRKMRNELYEIIYLKYRNLSRSIACETIQDLDLAEDIAQEVFKNFMKRWIHLI